MKYWKENNKNKYSGNSKIARILAIFFAGMLLFTFLSRFLDSMMIPKVQVSSWSSGNLSYTIAGEGEISPSETCYIYIPEGIRVDRVLSGGEKVKAGQGIVFLRISDLEEKKKQLERELQKLQLTLEQETLNGKPAARVPEQERQAGELLFQEKKIMEAAAQRQQAQEEYEVKRKELDEKRERDEDFAKQQLYYSREEVERMNRGLSKEDRQSYAQAELNYDMALAAIEEEYHSSLEELESKVRDAAEQEAKSREDYDRLLVQAELAVKEDEAAAANHSKAAQISRKTQEMKQLDIDACTEELQRLEELLLAEGQIRSTSEGIVTRMDVIPGEKTGGEEIVEIGSGAFLLTGTLDQEEAVLLEAGDSLEVSVPTVSRPVKGSLTGISYNPQQGKQGERNTQAVFTASLEEGEYQPGSMAGYTIKKSPALRYECRIPLTAVREDGAGKYCLIAVKTPTILGEEDIAERINLELLAMDDEYAAVSSIFNADDRIITGSNKAIKEGDRVRVQP